MLNSLNLKKEKKNLLCACNEKYYFILQLLKFYECDFIASHLSTKFWKSVRVLYVQCRWKTLSYVWYLSQLCPMSEPELSLWCWSLMKTRLLLVPVDDNQAELVAFVNQLILAFWLPISNTEHTSVYIHHYSRTNSSRSYRNVSTKMINS